MDRRTLLAFVLIFLILAGYPYLMNKFFPAPEPTAEQLAATHSDSTLVSSAPDQRAEVPDAGSSSGYQTPEAEPSESPIREGAVVTADQALVLTPGVTEQTVSVQTPLYRMEISTRGGRVTRWEGYEYDSWKGGPVQADPGRHSRQGTGRGLFPGRRSAPGQRRLRIRQGQPGSERRLRISVPHPDRHNVGRSGNPQDLHLPCRRIRSGGGPGGGRSQRSRAPRPDPGGFAGRIPFRLESGHRRHQSVRKDGNCRRCGRWPASARIFTTRSDRISRRVWKK